MKTVLSLLCDKWLPRVKGAHFVNMRVRKNGEWKEYEADDVAHALRDGFVWPEFCDWYEGERGDEAMGLIKFGEHPTTSRTALELAFFAGRASKDDMRVKVLETGSVDLNTGEREPDSKPTIAEIEAILNSPDDSYEVHIAPDGEVTTRPKLRAVPPSE
jgi:hypothetical protein